jgi:hypothetical protein
MLNFAGCASCSGMQLKSVDRTEEQEEEEERVEFYRKFFCFLQLIDEANRSSKGDMFAESVILNIW